MVYAVLVTHSGRRYISTKNKKLSYWHQRRAQGSLSPVIMVVYIVKCTCLRSKAGPRSKGPVSLLREEHSGYRSKGPVLLLREEHSRP